MNLWFKKIFDQGKISARFDFAKNLREMVLQKS
jgi:hypothetical protein